MQITHADADRATHVLIRAFHTDALLSTYMPVPSLRTRALHAYFAPSVKFALKHGEVWSSSAQFEAVAAWFPPDHADPPFCIYLTPDLLFSAAAMLSAGLRSTVEFSRVLGAVMDAHHQDMPKPHWYLSAIGTEPAFQGRGFGTQLLTPMLKRADVEGLDCYLETQAARNVPFYERHGFTIVRRFPMRLNGLALWTMRRLPQPINP